MPLGETISVGLKEWASVCGAVGAGRQIILLRKGGIYESGGEFSLEHRRFVLFPTYVHQKLAMLKEAEHGGFEGATEEPARVNIGLAGEVTDILQVQSRGVMDSLDAEHIWAPPLIDMRFNYRPENPLYLLVVRAYRLGRLVSIENTPAYAGCKSWVPLVEGISMHGIVPALDEGSWADRRGKVLQLARRS